MQRIPVEEPLQGKFHNIPLVLSRNNLKYKKIAKSRLRVAKNLVKLFLLICAIYSPPKQSTLCTGASCTQGVSRHPPDSYY